MIKICYKMKNERRTQEGELQENNRFLIPYLKSETKSLLYILFSLIK